MLHAVCHYLFSIFLGEVETYKIATDIPSYKFKEHATLYGRVEKVYCALICQFKWAVIN